jgi:hypothetical protein
MNDELELILKEAVVAQWILSRFMCDYRRGMDRWIDLLTIYTYNSELQANTISLDYTLHKSLHADSSLTCSVFNSRFLVTNVNSGDSSAFCAQVLPSRFQYRTDCQLSTELIAPILFFVTPRRGPRRQHPQLYE